MDHIYFYLENLIVGLVVYNANIILKGEVMFGAFTN